MKVKVEHTPFKSWAPSKIKNVDYRFSLSHFIVLLLLSVIMGCQYEGNLLENNEDIQSYEAILPEVLWEKFERISDPEEQAEFLLTLTEEKYNTQPNLALTLAEQSELLSSLKKDQTYARALYWKSFLVNQQSPEDIDLRRSLTDINISIDIFREAKSELWLARALNLLAFIHYNLREEDIGIEYNRQAFDVISSLEEYLINHCIDLGDIYRIKGNIAYYTEEKDSVLSYYDKAYSAYETCSNNKNNNKLARLLNNYAIYHELAGDYELADSLQEVAINLFNTEETLQQKWKAQLDYATFHARRFSFTEDIIWYEKSMDLLFDLLNNVDNLYTEIYYELAANHQNHAAIFETTQSLHYDSTAYYYGLVMDYGVKERNERYLQKTQESIGGICTELGSDSCSKLLNKSSAINSEIRYLTRLSFREAGSKREQFKTIKAKEKQRTVVGVLLIGFLILIAIFIILHQRSKVAFLRKQLDSRMEALRSQMNPHFISNSLNAIDSLVNKGAQEEASEYLIDFSRLCRLILNNSKVQFISLAKELETLQYYLSLEKLRMRSKLNYHFEIDESLNLDAIRIAPMVLQPFIENAIIHGIQNKQAPGNIWITISRVNDKLLEIRVKDDGVGREKAKALRANSVLDRPSWGMKITEERLQSLKQQQGAQIRYVDLFNEQGDARGTEVIVKYDISYIQK